MNKLLSVLIIGSLLALMPFFFFFVGLKVNYLDFYQIKEFFNVFFLDNMPWKIFAVLALVIGVLFVIPKRLYMGGFVLMLAMGVSLTMFLPSIAQKIGNELFAQKNFHIKKGKHLYKGTLLYEGRQNYYFVIDGANKTLTFQKDKIDETY